MYKKLFSVILCRILDICSIGANYNLGGRVGGDQSITGLGDLFSNFSGRLSHAVSSRSKRLRRTSKSQYRQLDPLRQNHFQRRPYTGGDRSESLCGESLRNRVGRTNYLGMRFGKRACPGAPDVALKPTRNKVQELILQCPNAYSQSSPATRMMLQAYNGEDTENVADYKWSEIFPVLPRSSVCNNSEEVISGLDTIVHPTHLQCAARPGLCRKLKLPHIGITWESSEADVASVSRGRYECNVPLGSVQSHMTDRRKLTKAASRVPDQNSFPQPRGEMFEFANHCLGTEKGVASYRKDDSISTGLVVKLPQIANLRIATQNS